MIAHAPSPSPSPSHAQAFKANKFNLVWILDTGASHHITANFSCLVNPTPYRELKSAVVVFFFFFLNCTSRGTKVHSGTPGPMAPGTLKQTHL